MYYLNLSEDKYLLSVSSTPMPDCPAIESLEGFDFSGVRIGAYRWDGNKLVLDGDKLARLEEEQAAAEKARREDAARTAASAEVQAALIAAQINTLSVDDDTALRWRLLYPAWTAGTAYTTGEKVRRVDALYRCLQSHTAQAGWEPETAASLWTEVCETHAGTADDPIPYGGNMVLEAGKYYSQDGMAYRCTRDTGSPVYNPLAELVGLYVEVVED